MKYVFTFIFIMLPSFAYAASFNELVTLIEDHPGVQASEYRISSIKEEGKDKSSWQEPVLRLDALNFPKDNLQMGNSPMTGMQVSLSQAVPLTNKYNYTEKEFNAKSKIVYYEKKTLKRKLIFGVWQNAIEKEKTLKDISIYKENLIWLENMIKVSNKLYTTGTIAQQAVLDLKIRKSEMKTALATNKEKLKKLRADLAKTLNNLDPNLDIDVFTIPWDYLSDYLTAKVVDNSILEFYKQRRLSAMYMHKAKKSDKIPDVTVGLNYRYRDNVDENGDFVGVFVSFPLTFGGKRSSRYRSAFDIYQSTEKELKDYQEDLEATKRVLKSEISEKEIELSILKNKIIGFAQTSRDITAKSYRVGSSDYLELLRSELQLQNLQVKKSTLEANLKNLKAQYLFEKGASMLPKGEVL